MADDLNLRIVKRTEPLSEAFLPDVFHGREELVRAIEEEVSRITRGERPRVVWVHGPPGTGKTSVVKKVLATLEERRVRTAYVNGWSSQTFYSVLDTVFDELRALVGETRDAAFKFERLLRLAAERPIVIALDEVDQMFLKERNTALYNLGRLERIGLVCLSQSRDAYLSLDARVQSRLQPVFVHANRYTTDQLVKVLEGRATASLEPTAWCREDLRAIAEAAAGDARIAVQSLRTAAYLAEKNRTPSINAADIQRGIEKSVALRRRYLLKGLSDHHRLLYQLVQEAGEISLRDLWISYRRRAPERGLAPMARRTFNHYRQFLVANRLLRERQAKGRGNARALQVVE